MRKAFVLMLALALTVTFTASAFAQSKVITKTVRKTIKPEIAPEPAPVETLSENLEEIPELPAPPPATSLNNNGIFGWNTRADVNGSYAYTSGQNGFFGLLGGGANIIFADPAQLGSKIGLAEDALEYKAGLGLFVGQDKNDLNMFSLPLVADATLYLKEGSLFGLDPFVGAGINLNLIGTDSTFGGLGYNLYTGWLADLGWGTGPTEFKVGYRSLKVGDIRTSDGIVFGIGQPIKL